MDSIDLQIIHYLEKNCRLSHTELAKLIHISRPSVYQRVAKLEKAGVIRGYKALVDWQQVKPCVKCLIFVKINGKYFSSLEKSIATMTLHNSVIESYHRLAGEWCLLLHVRLDKAEDVTLFLDQLWKFDGILETSTTFILDTKLF